MGGASTGGSGGSGPSGDCVKGQTKGNQVAVIGESFIAASHGITKQIESNAKAAGSLAMGEQYVDKSVSGTLLSGGGADAIPKQYDKAKAGGAIKYVLMDGGGNDCLQANNGDAALAAAQTLFQTMATDKVEKVQYFFYPDPLGSFASGTLKTCLDALRPKMKALCEGLTAPKCYWLDLRTVWNGHSEYTSDGIHPTPAGDKATGDAIWGEMKKNCIAQ
jgi:lysophospholipase L1-like esterase